MMLYQRILLLCFSMIIFLTGCNPAVYNQAEANVADVTQRATDAHAKMNATAYKNPTLLMNQGMYVDKTPISLAKQPAWLGNRVILRGDQLPFSYYSRIIVSGGGHNILTHYQNGLNDKLTVSMNYSGTVKGALDMLAAKTGFIYSVNCNDIYWQAFITRTFDIAFMPGSSDYMMGKAAGGSNASGAAGGGGGGGASGGSSTTITGTIDDSASAQYSNLKGTLSVWKDLETSIKQLLSPDGKVMVSEATTSVTVRDRPTNVALIGRFISNVNTNLSKQVLVKIEVLSVTLESDFNFGINWDIVQRAFNNGTYTLVAANGSPISLQTATQLTGLTSPNKYGVNNTFQDNNGGTTATGILALVNALQEQGKVSVVTQPQVLCQNNQVSQIRIIDQLGYLASIQTTALAGSTPNGSSITSQITPGAVVTGLTLYVLPKILGNKVYLQVNADL
jgi:type IVB pilus formation R64 PilN family outer membrane protein